jgi:hypothetical protein
MRVLSQLPEKRAWGERPFDRSYARLHAGTAAVGESRSALQHCFSVGKVRPDRSRSGRRRRFDGSRSIRCRMKPLQCAKCGFTLRAVAGLHRAGEPPQWRDENGAFIRCPKCGYEERNLSPARVAEKPAQTI